jgi:predicted ATP-grasp superfamily ATP-dependent carboligase
MKLLKNRRGAVKNKHTLDKFLDSQPISIFGVGVNVYNRNYLRDVKNKFHCIGLRETPRENHAANKNLLELTTFNDVNLAELKSNSLTVLSNHHTKEYIERHAQKALILPYKQYEGMAEYCQEHNYLLASASPDIVQKIDNKKTFRELLGSRGLSPYIAPHIEFKPRESSYEQISNELQSKVVVAQITKSGGGKGTFFIDSEEKYQEFLQDEYTLKGLEEDNEKSFIASKFVEGISASIIGVATRWGIFTSNTQVQVNKDEDAAAFRGHDWVFSKNYVSAKVESIAQNFTQKFGKEIYKMGFQGFFGIDLIITETECYVIECNPRITGTQPVLDMVQDMNNKPSFIGLHILEFLADEIPIEVNAKKLQRTLMRPNKKAASHFFIVQKEDIENTISKTIQEGSYRIANDKLEYVDSRNHPNDLESDELFIIAETPEIGRIMNKRGRLCRVVSRKQILQSNGRETTPWVKQIEQLVENAIK